MNLLSSIGSAIKGAASKVKSAISSVGSYLASPGNLNKTATAGMSFPLLPGTSLSGPNQSVLPNMTVAPTATDPGGPGYAYNGGAISVNNPAIAANTNKAAVDATNIYSAARPSTAQQFSQPSDLSNPNVGNPYFDSQGRLVIPKVGFSGQQGQGGGSITSLPTQGPSGASGIGGGGANFTGLLSAAGGVGTPALSSGDEQARKRQEQINAAGTPSVTGAPTIIPGITPVSPAQSLTTQMPGVEVDLQELSSLLKQTQKLASSPLALSSSDFQDTANQITSRFVELYQKYNADKPLPPNPVIDTREQQDFIQQSGQPSIVAQAIDNWKASNTNLDSLIRNQNDVNNQISALNDAYKPILEDIRTNPNLPKGLAARRMDEITRQQKESLSGLLRQKEILGQQIEDQNRSVNQAFQIAQFAENQEEKKKDNARADLQLYITSGAIGAFTDAEIRDFASSSGYSVAQLKTIRDSAKNPNIETQIVGSADSGYSLITFDKNGQVKSTQKVLAGGGSTADQASSISAQLLDSRNQGPEADGVYADPNLYAKLRQTAKMSSSEFDGRFGYLVNPASKANLGIGTAASSSITPVAQLSPEQNNIINEAKAAISVMKQNLDQQLPQKRQMIIDRIKQQSNFDIGPYI